MEGDKEKHLSRLEENTAFFALSKHIKHLWSGEKQVVKDSI